jgi:tetratricopeptide (TPR) repeat protein
MLDKTIQAQMLVSQGLVEQAFAAYQEAHSYDTVLDRDSRQAMNKAFVGALPQMLSANFSPDKAMQIAYYNIEMAEKNVAYNPQDSLNLMVLAQVYGTASQIAAKAGQNQLAMNWYAKTMESIDKSIEASPNRVQVYFQKAQFQLSRGAKAERLETLKFALSLNPEFNESSCHLARAYLYFGQEKEAQPYLDKCIDTDGLALLNQEQLLKVLADDYGKKSDWPRVAKLQAQLTLINPKSVEYWVQLAKTYGKMGDKEKASSSIAEAVKLDRSIEREAKKFYESIEKK